LRQCFPDVERLVDFTLVFKNSSQQYNDYDKATGRARAFTELVKKAKDSFSQQGCLKMSKGISALIVQTPGSFVYPTALMQRIAHRSALTEYVLPLEIGMRPSVALCAFAKQELVVDHVANVHDRGTGKGLRAFAIPGEYIVFGAVLHSI
jgi:hypothetical protein